MEPRGGTAEQSAEEAMGESSESNVVNIVAFISDVVLAIA